MDIRHVYLPHYQNRSFSCIRSTSMDTRNSLDRSSCEVQACSADEDLVLVLLDQRNCPMLVPYAAGDFIRGLGVVLCCVCSAS